MGRLCHWLVQRSRLSHTLAVQNDPRLLRPVGWQTRQAQQGRGSGLGQKSGWQPCCMPPPQSGGLDSKFIQIVGGTEVPVSC